MMIIYYDDYDYDDYYYDYDYDDYYYD